MTIATVELVHSVLWYAHPALQLGVAAVMVQRKSHRTFPVFFIYLLFQVLVFLIVFPSYRWGAYVTFFYSYWIGAIISLAIGFKVIHEIFLDVFRPFHTLKDLGTLMFKWAALVMLLVAGVVAASSSSSSDTPLVEAVLTVQRCVRVIQIGLIMFLLVFSKYLGINWRQHSFGIALGFGSFAGVELFLVALHTSGHINQMAVSLINMAAYNISVIVWLGYALLKKEARESTSTLLLSQRWEQSLADLQGPASTDSLIPMFEGMVNRAFTRNPMSFVSEPVPPEQPGDPEKRASAASAQGPGKS